MIEAHRVTVVPTSLIEVDTDLWNAVRLAWLSDCERMGAAESPVFPVFAHAGRLVLLGGFGLFLALQAAGATRIRVWRAEIADGESPTEYAVAFAMPRTDPTPS